MFMYKDVWKKILAAVISICLVVTLVQFPDVTVRAEEAKTYYDYRHTGAEQSGTISSKRAAAVFSANQGQGEEFVESASFDVFMLEGTDASTTKATVSLYLNPDASVPDSGTFVCSSEIYGLTEGTNHLVFNMGNAVVAAGGTFSVIVILEGDGVSFYADAGGEMGRTFADDEDGNWIDLASGGQYANISAKTSLAEPVTEESGILDKIADFFSGTAETMKPESTGGAGNTDSGTTGDLSDNTEKVQPDSGNAAETENSSEKSENEKITESEEAAEREDTTEEAINDKEAGLGMIDSTEEAAETEKTNQEAVTGALTSNTQKKTEENAALYAAGMPELEIRDMQIPVGTTSTLKLNNAAAGVTYTWSSSNESVASVTADADSASASVTANAFGTAVITVTDNDTFSGSCTVNVKKDLGLVFLMLDETDFVYDGTQKKPGITVIDEATELFENQHFTISYGENTKAGTEASVTISGIGQYSGSLAQTFTIQQKPVDDLQISWKAGYEKGLPFTGDPADVSLGIVVTDAGIGVDGTELIYGADYELVYDGSDDHITEGKHTVIVRGINNYENDKEVEYNIYADVSDQLEIQLESGGPLTEDSEYVYTGQEIHPKIKVLYNEKELTEDVDYTISYTDCTNAGGNAMLTVTGINSYDGETTANYKVIPKDFSEQDGTLSAIIISPDELVAARGADTTTPVTPYFEAAYNGEKLRLGTDFIIDSYQLPDEKDWQTAPSASMTIQGQGNFKGYRTLVYTIGSDLVSVLGSVNIIADQTFTGKDMEPEITFANAADLENGKDYIVRYENNRNAGTATVTVRGIGSYGGELTQTFTILPMALGSLDMNSFIYDEQVQYYPEDPGSAGIVTELQIVYHDNTLIEGEDYTVAYSNNQSVISNAKIEVTAGSSGNFTGSRELIFEITRCPLSNGNITISGVLQSYIYTGTVIEPEPVLTFNGVSDPLIKDTDYTISYANNISAGSYASVTINGIGNYSGSKSVTFTITKIPIENVVLEYAADATDVSGYNGLYMAMKQYDDGKKITLDSNIVLHRDKAAQAAGEPPLQLDTDYRLTYDNHKTVSTAEKTATVTIEGMGDYGGSRTFKFLIARGVDELSIPAIDTQTYTGEPITISDFGIREGWFNELTAGTDYKVNYVSNENCGTATVTITGTEVPTEHGCYTGSISRSFTIGARNMLDANVAVEIREQPYEGIAVEIPVGQEDQEITAVLTNPATGNEKTLICGTDYTILAGSYTDNNGKGTASVILEGTGNFIGQRTVEFEIGGKSIDDAGIEVTIESGTGTDGAWIYTGSQITPAVTVKDVNAAYTLKLGTDYRMQILDNVNAGAARVSIVGRGSYSGSRMESFIIEELDISDSSVYTVSAISDQTFTGGEIEPVPTVSYTSLGGMATDLGTNDIKLSYKNNTDVTTGGNKAEVTVSGNGNYKGFQTVTFDIVPKDIGDVDVVIEAIPTQAATGIKVCPEIIIQYGDYKLVSENEKDFKAVYSDNIMNGTASVALTGVGNFKGTANTTFKIRTPLNEDDFEITFEGEDSYVYTGKEIEPKVNVKELITGNDLTEASDFQVSYAYNKDASTDTLKASVTVYDIKEYVGSKTFTFTILKKDIGDEDVTAVLQQKSYDFTGLQITPRVMRVNYNGQMLKTGNQGNDYIVTYGANRNAGVSAGSVVIDASDSSNFTGVKTLHFDIIPKSIGSGTSFASGFLMDPIPVQGYTGTDVCPIPVVKHQISGSNTYELKNPDDFTVSYEDNVEVGTASYTIEGTGNYKGGVTGTFVIGGNLEDAVVTGIEERYDYGGTAICPKPESVTVNGTMLTEGVDYELAYNKNDDVGEAVLTIKGINAYGGSKEIKFGIYGDISGAAIDPIGDEAYTGSPIEPAPVVRWQGRTLDRNTDYKVEYSNQTEIGTAKVTITGMGYFKEDSSKEITFEIVKPDGLFQVSEIGDYYYCGKDVDVKFTVSCNNQVLIEDTDYTLTFSDKKNAGTQSVRIEGINNYASIPSTTKTFTILKLDVSKMYLEDSSNADVIEGIADYEYTGKQIVPKLKLSYREDGNTIYELTEDDYSIECGENIEVGPAKVTVKGSGINCIGTREETFTINPRHLDHVTVSEIVSQVYTGSEIKPDITLKNGTILLTESDYNVTGYSNHTDAGIAVMHLEGMGTNYTGTRDVEFEILPMDLGADSISISQIQPQAFTGFEIKPDVTVTYTDQKGTRHTLSDEDYGVEYSDNVNRGTSAFVKVIGKDKNYTGTKQTTFTITERDINADNIEVLPIPNQAYTGSAIMPSVTILCKSAEGEYTLQEGDYSLSFTDNTDIGVASVTIKGEGNFTGTRLPVTFTIANGIENAEIIEGLETNYTYTGSEITPAGLVVKIGENELTEGEDYTISYDKNKDAGTAALTLIGAGSYGGSKDFTFTIDPKPISDPEVVMEGFQKSLGYTGGEVTQQITLTYGEETLQEGTDYVVGYKDNIDIGTAQMEIVGLDKNYTGSFTEEFAIGKTLITDSRIQVTGISSAYTYKGEEIRPEPVVKLDGADLVKDTDYTVGYTDNVNAGKATITITGAGQYEGERTVTFDILRKSIMLCEISNVDDQIYTGGDLTPEVVVKDESEPLQPGDDFTLMYQSNRNAGVGSVVIGGMNNYTVTKVGTFKILPGGVSAVAVTSASVSSLELTWSGSGKVTGYEVYRSISGSASFTRVARTKNMTYIDKELTSGTMYTYRVRSYLVDGNETYYSSYSDVISGSTY